MSKNITPVIEFWVSVALFLFSVAYGVGAIQLPLPQGSDSIPITPRSIPIFLSFAGAFLSLVIIIQTFVSNKSLMFFSSSQHQSKKNKLKKTVFTVALLLFFMVTYGFLLPWLGFLVSSFGFICASIIVLGQRKWYVFLGVPLVTVVVFWLLLDVLLGVYLGEGELFFLLTEFFS